MRDPARGRIRRRNHRRLSLAADQAPLHRPADHAPAARVRGNLLQFGVLQDPAPLVFPQRFHLRAPGDLDRLPREHRADRQADLPRLLSGARRPRRHARTDRHELPARAAVRGSGARHGLPDAGDRRRIRRVRRSGQLPDPRAVLAVLPQQERVDRRPHHQRRSHAAVRGAGAARRRRRARARHGAAAPRSAAGRWCSASRTRISSSTWTSRRPTRAFSARSCRASRRPRSTRRSGCRSRARTCSIAICCITCRIRATASSSRPASRGS
ncbi:MAG: hypothetical protein GAK41_01148 [Burkholderia gladioli]|nr:MAG: hypothetical protein GAK41_01148 [Burkholderia gladioli]